MDVMKIKTDFMRSNISKLLSLLLKKKFKRDIKFQLNDLDVQFDDNKVNAHLELDVCLTKEELSKIFKEIL